MKFYCGSVVLQLVQYGKCLIPAGSADKLLSHEIITDLRAIGMVENSTTVILGKMNASHSCRLAMRHPGYRRRNGGRNATGTA